MYYKRLVIKDVVFTDDSVYAIITNGISEHRDGFRLNSAAYTFNSLNKQFFVDNCVMYALCEFGVLADEIHIEVPVSLFIYRKAQAFINDLYSWVSHFSGKECVARLTFTSYVGGAERAWFTPTPKKAVIGWSRGKESIACYEIGKEAGYDVHKATFNKPVDKNDDAVISLISEGPLYVEPTTIKGSVFENTYFDYQGYICVPLIAALVLVAESHKAKCVMIGSEYGTSEVWNLNGRNVHNLAADESLVTAQWFQGYMNAAHKVAINVQSPVATIFEPAIIAYIVSKGYAFDKLESCWNYSAFAGQNCEGCLKCNRLKVYGRYLVKQGKLSADSFEKTFKIKDFPNIASSELFTYCFASAPMHRGITGNDYEIDWASSWFDNPREVEFTGQDFLEVIKKHFTQVDYTKITQKEPRLNAYDALYVKKEVDRYLGEDYTQRIVGMQPLLYVGIGLPWEQESFYGVQHSFCVLDYYDTWEVYNGNKPVGVVAIEGTHRLPTKGSALFKTDALPVKLWLQEKNIRTLLNQLGVCYEYRKY